VRPEVSLQRHQPLWDFRGNLPPPPKGQEQLKATAPVQSLVLSGQDNTPVTAEQRAQKAFTDKGLLQKRLGKTKSQARSRAQQPSGTRLPGST